jgi:hypothetical protein
MRTINIAKTEIIKLNKIGYVSGNRNINKPHVQKMYSLIGAFGFADTIKVVRHHRKYYVLEGQNRLEALKLHKVKEAPCSVIDWIGDSFEDLQKFIISLNAYNKKWNIDDYIHSYASNGNRMYVHLKNQVNKYSKQLSTGVVVTCYTGISRGQKPLKEGRMTFVDEEFSDYLVHELSKLVSKFNKRKLPAQSLRSAVFLILRKKNNKYEYFESLKLSIVNHLSVSKEPLPDGDDAFRYWFDNVVENMYIMNYGNTK